MLSRKDRTEKAREIPLEWLEQAKKVLSENYLEFIKDSDFSFQTFGEIYPDECCLALCLVNRVTENSVSLILSLDIDSNKFEASDLNNLLDASSLFFDQYFNTKDWDEYEPSWGEEEFKNKKFFSKVSRENIGLTLQAEKLLAQED
jgi:hypothetical protein